MARIAASVRLEPAPTAVKREGSPAALVGALVAALTTLPGLGLGTLWDNSETTYGEVAREVLLYRDAVVMHFNGTPWFVQPPLYFWVAAAFAKVLGMTELALRLPSALATIAMAAAVGFAVGRRTQTRAGILAATVLATSLMQVVIGRLAIMDALLDLAVTLAILAFFAALQSGRTTAWYLGWTALGLGILAKGPVAAAVTLLVIVPWSLWERSAGERLRVPSAAHWLAGPALMAALLAPWTLALWQAAGPSAFGMLVGHYSVGRYLGTIENQSGPIWYYLPVAVLGVFPWFPFLVPASLQGWREARGPSGSLYRLALLWLALPFVFFSCAQTKLPNYVALELAAFAILVGLWFERDARRKDRRPATLWAAGLPLTIGAAAFAIAVFSQRNRLTPELQSIATGLGALGAVLSVGSVACAALLSRRSTARFAPFALAGASAAAMLGAALSEPLVETFKPIPPLAAVVRHHLRNGDAVAIQGVSGSPALIFYTRPVVVSLDASGGQNSLRRLVCSVPRAFVITAKEHALSDPAYGRTRRRIAAGSRDELLLYAGPRCAGSMLPP